MTQSEHRRHENWAINPAVNALLPRNPSIQQALPGRLTLKGMHSCPNRPLRASGLTDVLRSERGRLAGRESIGGIGSSRT